MDTFPKLLSAAFSFDSFPFIHFSKSIHNTHQLFPLDFTLTPFCSSRRIASQVRTPLWITDNNCSIFDWWNSFPFMWHSDEKTFCFNPSNKIILCGKGIKYVIPYLYGYAHVVVYSYNEHDFKWCDSLKSPLHVNLFLWSTIHRVVYHIICRWGNPR